MEKNMVDVTLHIDESTTQEDRESLRDVLLAKNGVDAVDVHDEKPHLFEIVYDPDAVSSDDFLKMVKDRGLHAELIGL